MEPDFLANPLLPETKSEVAIPLIAADQVIGVLDLQDDQPHRFSRSDLDTFCALAGHIATTLHNARLFEEQKQAEEALRKSEERFRTVADFTYDWEYWIGPDGNYLYVSPSCERITGYTANDFMEQDSLCTYKPNPRNKIRLTEDFHGDLLWDKPAYSNASRTLPTVTFWPTIPNISWSTRGLPQWIFGSLLGRVRSGGSAMCAIRFMGVMAAG